MTDLEKFINNEVVVTSGMVVDYCVKTLGITEVNARKRIQRLPKSIYKVKGICKDQQSILFHVNNQNSEFFYDKLLEVLKTNANQHYQVINGLLLHYGTIEKEKLASFSVSPIINTRGHKNFDTIIHDLRTLRLIYESDNKYSLSDIKSVNDNRAKGMNIIHSITIAQFHEWARNIGLISYNSAKFESQFSRYQFGMVAPSYIKSLVTNNGGKSIPVFVLVDIVLKSDIKAQDVQFIIKKLENISMQKQFARFIPFILISSHNSEVYNALKRNGIVIGNIDDLFGEKYSKTIFGILNLLENAGAILKDNPEQYVNLLADIKKLSSGKTYNLKGDLFEMAVGLFHGQQCQNLDISKRIIFDGKQVEVDVYAVYQDKVVFAECKGYNSQIDDEYVQTWISEKIPTMRKWALSCDSLTGRNIEFEIWCTGGFSDTMEIKLNEHKRKTKKYILDYFDLNKMRRLAREKNIRHFEKLINTYYDTEI